MGGRSSTLVMIQWVEWLWLCCQHRGGGMVMVAIVVHHCHHHVVDRGGVVVVAVSGGVGRIINTGGGVTHQTRLVQ